MKLSIQMKKVPFVCGAKPVPCVWDISSFITPFLRMVHDFGNVHHFWLHKSVEGNVVLHFKRYTKDRWLPDSADPTTYLSDEDKYGILVFKEKPHGRPKLVQPMLPLADEELEKLKTSVTKMFKHPLLQDEKLEERKLWWEEYLAGNAFKPQNTMWPVGVLRQKRVAQNSADVSMAREATDGLEHAEVEMPMVYSGHYLDPNRKEKIIHENRSMNNGEWPVKKVVKERINPRTHKKQYLVEWKPSWVEAEEMSDKCMQAWEAKKKKI
ncbi:hypothetical protein OS493_019067 [Desmophyllum pertusum]|uniref:Uncharacterized protein n=1 Tax=Desmophyllum pertusum TaxID=174260 RepID=A0A9W9YZV1_9CNID|nr:hypothetical protein OS493_019067 [Desmophyllum pertusum]